jgi:hypothetical protein
MKDFPIKNYFLIARAHHGRENRVQKVAFRDGSLEVPSPRKHRLCSRVSPTIQSDMEAAPPPGQFLLRSLWQRLSTSAGSLSSPQVIGPASKSQFSGHRCPAARRGCEEAPEQRTAYFRKVLPAGDQPFLNFSVRSSVNGVSHVRVGECCRERKYKVGFAVNPENQGSGIGDQGPVVR